MRNIKSSHNLEVSDCRRNAPKWAQNRSESLCAGLWVPCRMCWAWFGPALGPNPARNPRFPAGSSKVFGALCSSAEMRSETSTLTPFVVRAPGTRWSAIYGCGYKSFRVMSKLFFGQVIFWRLGAPRPKKLHIFRSEWFVGLAAEDGKATKPFVSVKCVIVWPWYPRPPKKSLGQKSTSGPL